MFEFSTQFGAGYLAVTAGTAQRFPYTPLPSNMSPWNGYSLICLGEGRARGAQGGHCADMEGAGLVLLDLSASGELELTADFRLMALLLPRELLERHIARPHALCAAVVTEGQSGAARIALRMLQSLAENHSRVPPPDADALLEELARAAARAYGSLPACGSSETARSILLTRIRQYVLLHLQEDMLTHQQTAAAIGLSEMDLKELLRLERTTLSRMIWLQRLEEARRMLSLRALADRSVKEIAWACGFKDMSHFSCAFKTRFGSGPREFRQARPT